MIVKYKSSLKVNTICLCPGFESFDFLFSDLKLNYWTDFKMYFWKLDYA